ncbi:MULTISPECIES: hypothetical protein [Aminobacterium]|jgi:hypothetical protein|uniref:hypothetical protein n=1 Tax=Aminobacterium TaxID=81466 RepID=UPI002581076F|nr:hypothetical protein [Aminobacterium sp. UBA4987]
MDNSVNWRYAFAWCFRVVFVFLVAGIAYNFFIKEDPEIGRYQIATAGNGMTYQIDTKTGTTRVLLPYDSESSSSLTGVAKGACWVEIQDATSLKYMEKTGKEIEKILKEIRQGEPQGGAQDG